jgi:hypothetical protein
MLMKLSGGALSTAVVRSVLVRLPPSQPVQFNHMPFYISNGLAVDVFVQTFAN